MKKLLLLSVVLFATTAMMADQISVQFTFGGSNSVDASLSGVFLGPALNIAVSDQTTGQVLNLTGLSATSTGTATSFTVSTSPDIVVANYNAGGTVLVTDGGGHVLIFGFMNPDSSLLSSYPNGRGAFLGGFDVASVSPSLLAMFGLGPEFLPLGSVSATFGNANLTGFDQLTANVGGGSVTIQTSPIPEPSTLALVGSSILLGVFGLRRKLQ